MSPASSAWAEGNPLPRNETQIEASPEAVWTVLADPFSYEHWVVGSADIRDVEGDWPDVGATFHHTQGLPKLGLKDTTTVLESDPKRRLKLCVRARPMVIAEVELNVSAAGQGTRVAMIEVPVGGVVGKLHNPAFEMGLRLRNAESLRRLKRLAEGS